MNALRLTRVLLAPPDRVWHALTDPAALAAWFWPLRMTPTVEAELRPGGRYRIAASSPAMAVCGEYVLVEPPTRLSFTWRWDTEPDQTLVTIRLAPCDAGTELTLVHERFSDGASRDNHLKGWEDCLDRLPAWLARHIP
jgi:uncharacterized protein YndB with AHSA1/START domain